MSAIIEAAQLSKWFGEVLAVNNLDVTVETGVTGLLGPNGAGKSTFIKLALGLYAPSRGTVRVFGQAPRNNLAVLHRIGYCPELDTLFENVTGYEFVCWGCRFHGMRAAAARRAARAALERVRMTDRMDDPVGTYSKGMRQRTKLANALAHEPELLFLDEPLAGLDPQGREEVFSLVTDYARQGRAVIMSSHILYEVERVTRNVILLHNGSLLARGDIGAIRNLIDGHPHAVRVETDDPRRLAAHFLDDGAVLGVEFDGGSVVIRTRDPNGLYERINRIARENGGGIRSLACPDDNLQAVFDYLME